MFLSVHSQSVSIIMVYFFSLGILMSLKYSSYIYIFHDCYWIPANNSKNYYRHVLLELKIPFQVQVGIWRCFFFLLQLLYFVVCDSYILDCFQSTNGSTMRSKKKIQGRDLYSVLHVFLHLISTHQSGSVIWMDCIYILGHIYLHLCSLLCWCLMLLL